MSATSSSVYAVHYPLDRGYDGCCSDRACTGIVLWLYRICSLVLGVVAPRSVSWLCFWSVMWVRWGWSTPAGTEAVEYSSSWATHVQVCSCVNFRLLCRPSDYTVMTSLIPTFNICIPAAGLVFLACMLSHFSHVQLFATPWTVAHQAPLSMGFSRQEHCSGLQLPSPGDLPNLGIKHMSLVLQVDSFLTEPPGYFLSIVFTKPPA